MQQALVGDEGTESLTARIGNERAPSARLRRRGFWAARWPAHAPGVPAGAGTGTGFFTL